MSGLFFASFFYDKIGILLVICIAVLTYIYGNLKSYKLRDYCIILLSFITAVSANRLYTSMYYDKIISYSGYTGSFSGKITDYDVYDGDFAVYVADGKIDGVQKAEITIMTNELDVKYGDILSIDSCAFNEIEGDYLFDSKTWNKSRHIFLETSAQNGISIEHTGKGKIRQFLADFREQMIFSFRTKMGDNAGGFLSGMIFGEKRYLDDNVKDSLYRSGIGHILAVSGLHVSIIAALVMKLLKRAGVNKYFRFAVINSLFLLLITLTNYPVSAIRAALMLDIMYSAELFRQQNDSLNSLSIAALAICLFDPYAVYSSGFILSLSGTFGIAVFSPYMTEKINKEKITGRISAAFVTAFCTALAVMPASMYYFDETSLISPVTNVFLIPLCTAAMIIGVVFIVTGGCLTAVLYPAEMMIAAVLKITDITSSVTVFHMPKTSGFLPLLFIISAGITAAVYLYIGRRSAVSVTLAAVISLNSIASVTIQNMRRNQLIVAVLGKGGNAAVVISDSGRTVIADLSGYYRTTEYVRKYLTENGIDSADSLILTDSVRSQYAVYKHETDLIRIDKIYVIGETEQYGDIAEVISTDGITVENENYTLEYSEDCLTVTAENTEILFAPAKSEINASADLTIYCGKIPKSRNTAENGNMFLEDTNNFEIVLKDSGEYSIRRL